MVLTAEYASISMVNSIAVDIIASSVTRASAIMLLIVIIKDQGTSLPREII